MNDSKDIVLVVDYHLENLQIRQLDRASGEELCFRRRNTPQEILRVVRDCRLQAAVNGGKVVWIMESTTGWARVKDLLGSEAQFVLANVLQMPLPPKARRRKTDKIDTARLQREYLDGRLPVSFQPSCQLRQVRRLVDCRQDLVRRQTALKNWISHFLSHETWFSSENLWSDRGMKRLKSLELNPSDSWLLRLKIQDLEQVLKMIQEVQDKIMQVYSCWPQAQWLDEVRGIGPISAVTILAYIGPIERFASSDQLVGYAGLTPGIHQSDQRSTSGHIGGGGTHSRLRFFLIEATRWLATIPRYKAAHERVLAKRGARVARIVLARMFLRSIDKMLRDNIKFRPEASAA